MFHAAWLAIALVMIAPVFRRPHKMASFGNGDWLQIYFHHYNIILVLGAALRTLFDPWQ